MRYGIIADIHSNQEALETVLAALAGKVDRIICLGDIIGYGPNPNECCEIIKGNNITAIAGNHEKAALDELTIEYFNPFAAAAIIWTKKVLNAENVEYLRSLPIQLDFPGFQIVHGSLINPVEEYLDSIPPAVPTFELMKESLLFVGHTHKPLRMRYKNREILNPGSVGQPRDGDPRAAYIIYDGENKQSELYRVEYDILAIQEKMIKAGLPEKLIKRLSVGR